MGNKESERELLEKRIRVEMYSSYVLLGSLLIMILSLTYFYIYSDKLTDECYESNDEMKEYYLHALDSMKFYNIVPEDVRFGVNGMYYYGEDFYCVNTKNQNWSEILDSDYHEACHALIAHDNESHFCKNG